MIVFAGPSIALSEIRQMLDAADIRPPARTGDIYKASQEMPNAIGLIDGFFDGVPSVWHKEILWAMSQGIAVFGASSMGALRAAELHDFGMIGVGAIFEAFRDGRLEDDDEVALRHGPREMNYVALSEPMVNIRASLDRAVVEGILERSDAFGLTKLAKEMFFAERTWDALFTHAFRAGIDKDAVEGLQSWLPNGRVDQKRQDASVMLARMAAYENQSAATQEPDFDFQHTVMWADLKRQCESTGPSLLVSLIVDMLQHDPDLYNDLRQRAANRILVNADRHVPRTAVDDAVTHFRSENQLYTGLALDRWLDEHELDLETLRARFEEDIQTSFAVADNPTAFRDALLATLKEQGDFEAFMAAAKTQADIFRRSGLDMPSSESIGIAPAALLLWYFEDFRNEAVPHDMDIFLLTHDFGDRAEFERMMARQYVLWHNRGKRDLWNPRLCHT